MFIHPEQLLKIWWTMLKHFLKKMQKNESRPLPVDVQGLIVHVNAQEQFTLLWLQNNKYVKMGKAFWVCVNLLVKDACQKSQLGFYAKKEYLQEQLTVVSPAYFQWHLYHLLLGPH